MRIGATIRAEREAQKMTREELSFKSGISLSQIYKIETDSVKSSTKSDTLFRLASVLGIRLKQNIIDKKFKK